MKQFLKFLKPTLAFIILFLLFFYLINFKAYNIQVLYYWNNIFHREKASKQVEAYLPNIQNVKIPKPIWQENHLVIPLRP